MRTRPHATLAMMALLLLIHVLVAPAAAADPQCSTNPSPPRGLVREAHPVVLVHGWRGDPMQSTRKALEDTGMGDSGWQFLLFDYHSASDEWAASDSVAVCLARYLQQVSKAHQSAGGGGRVYVVTHSMGGLALRFALARDPDLAKRVGGVVTLDTPHQGSPWGNSGQYAEAVDWLNTTTMGGDLGPVPEPNSRASRCLAVHNGGRGLPSGCEAPPYLPTTIPVAQISGEAIVERTFFGWHAYDLIVGGDGIVPSSSSTGYLKSAAGDTVGRVVSIAPVPCRKDMSALLAEAAARRGPILGLAGALGQMWYDGKALDAVMAGRADFASLQFLLVTSAFMPCGHTQITTMADAIDRTAEALRTMTAPLTAADLRSAPVPALCGFPRGTLANGVLPGIPASRGIPPTLTPAFGGQDPDDLMALGDLNGDGVGDAAAVVNCNAGGVSWPDNIVFWARRGQGPVVLGAYEMAEAVGDARNGTLELTYAEGSVTVNSLDARPFDAGCCASGRATVTLRWDGSRIVAADVQHHGGANDASFAGIGDVELGMSAQQLTGLGYVAQEGDYYGCVFYSASDDRPTATYNPFSGEVVAIDPPYQEPIGTDRGVGVGSLFDDVRSAYADETIEDHLDGTFGQGMNGLAVGDGSGAWISFASDDTFSVSTVSVSDREHLGAIEAGCF